MLDQMEGYGFCNGIRRPARIISGEPAIHASKSQKGLLIMHLMF